MSSAEDIFYVPDSSDEENEDDFSTQKDSTQVSGDVKPDEADNSDHIINIKPRLRPESEESSDSKSATNSQPRTKNQFELDSEESFKKKSKTNSRVNFQPKLKSDSKILPESNKRKSKVKKEEEIVDESIDYTQKIEELKEMLEMEASQFEVDLEDLKRKHTEKLSYLKQTNIAKEQAASSAYDLEYRNVIWTTTLKHLNRGCFTENLSALFEEALSEEHYKLEKEIIELNQKNEDELAQYRASIPKLKATKSYRKKRRKPNFDSVSPKEMAKIIYNKFFMEQLTESNDPESEANRQIEKMMRKLQKESAYLTSRHFEPRVIHEIEHVPSPIYTYNNDNYPSRGMKAQSPFMKANKKAIDVLGEHREITKNLQKSVKVTDKYLKDLQDRQWFRGMFPHVSSF